jgi:hypothetical protein
VNVAVRGRDQTIRLGHVALIGFIALRERIGRLPFVDQQAAVEPTALVERRHQLEPLNGADAKPFRAVG